MTISDIPGDLPRELLLRLQQRLLQEVRDAAESRISDVRRGAESPAVASELFDKFGWGMTTAARVIGLETGALQQEIDVLARRIDPDFESHRNARWNARPAAFSFEGR
ncbi:hypothetical protein DelCs14_1779 [Delftia sp. Cs1-4]|uniref:hypothetical protein n=1 Tax=Delftia sp. (strain Cs1-4) TaxID=742013 RepID=UPI00020E7BD6|nr:hypothetical protein [Delftia sp. Cs1-4]AEF88805.1 hypothetical protein DelCs14_1779 [Delftia sp. Cs1-4]